ELLTLAGEPVVRKLRWIGLDVALGQERPQVAIIFVDDGLADIAHQGDLVVRRHHSPFAGSPGDSGCCCAASRCSFTPGLSLGGSCSRLFFFMGAQPAPMAGSSSYGPGEGRRKTI